MPVPTSGQRRRAAGLRRAAGALAVAAAAAALWSSALSAAAAPLPQNQAPPREGGQYWAGRYGCVACHGGRGEGTPIGPPLVGRPDSPLSYEMVLSQVRTPVLIMPDFPASVVSDEKVAAIVEYFHGFEPAR